MRTSALTSARAISTSLPGQPATTTRLRLSYLDGLRGLAALYVTIYHAFTINGVSQVFNDNLPVSLLSRLKSQVLEALIFRHGPQAVAIFIVISGYSLMLPVVQRHSPGLPDGLPKYLARRTWRIIPPYYAALILTLGLFLLLPALNLPSATSNAWNEALPALTPQAIISHFLLVHDLSSVTVLKISPPFWSIAVEWQLYFVFPLLLLPLRARLGGLPLLLLSFTLSLGAYFWLGDKVYLPNPWFLGLFTLGMIAADLNFNPQNYSRLTKTPWLAVAGIAFGLFVGQTLLEFDFWLNWPGVGSVSQFFHTDRVWLKDCLVGLATAAFIVHYTNRLLHRSTLSAEPATHTKAERSRVLSFLESRPVAFLGRISYSLYLIHNSLLIVLSLICQSGQISRLLSDMIALLVGVPLCLAVAYLFYRLVERPSLNRARRV